jgi:hypothetical protein
MKHSTEPVLPRKWAVRAHGQRNVFSLNPNESARHVIMKAVLWGLYLPSYPSITVEIRIGDRYKPDLVAYQDGTTYDARTGEPRPIFWGEAGVVSQSKLNSILRRFPDTHFAFARWEMGLSAHVRLIDAALHGLKRGAPVDLIRVSGDVLTRHMDESGMLTVEHADFESQRWNP